MAGIYLHIPFCKQACTYCDFHFSTAIKTKSELVKSILKEIQFRKAYLENEMVDTIYFGGGTPSLLSQKELQLILDTIRSTFEVVKSAEITLEANPDDLTSEKLQILKSIGINRLSIGVQSIYKSDLQFMNRAHTAHQSIRSIKLAYSLGFENISIDLIYGSPHLTNELWLKQLKEIEKLNIPHISCYALTVEEGTALHSYIKKKIVKPLDENKASQQFQILMDFMKQIGNEHYEISNFCKPGKYSKHNTSYWRQKKYLGIGPSAHSFNGFERSWNVANNNQYIKGINMNTPIYEFETLTPQNRFNEYIMTSLRTKWGIDLNYLLNKFELFYNSIAFQNTLKKYLKNNFLVVHQEKILLTQKGKNMADKISSDLFV